MMSIHTRLPVITLAAEALIESARSAPAFLKIHLLPMTIYTLVLTVARVAWFEYGGQPHILPFWVEVILYVPFSAVISIMVFQYFRSGILPRWRDGFRIKNGFWVAVSVLLVVNLVFRYTPIWESHLVETALQIQFGPDWTRVAIDAPQSATLTRFTVQICGLVINAFVGMLSMGLVWFIANKERVDIAELGRLISFFPISLLAYFLLFEVVSHQINVLYAHMIDWLGISLPARPNSQIWRERFLPEFLRELPFIVQSYVVNLVWYASIAIVYRWLDKKQIEDRSV